MNFNRILLTVGKTGLCTLLAACLFGFTFEKKELLVKETGAELHIQNKKVELIISKSTWHLKLLDENGNVQYEEAKSPSFFIKNEWISITKVKEVIKVDRDKVELKAGLSNDGNSLIQIDHSGDYGFRILIDAPEQRVSAVKGTTRLKMVEEVYGFGEMWNGHIAQRGQSFDIWDHVGTPDECAYMPYYVSTNNYTFFLNYGGNVTFDVGQKRADELVYTAPTNQFEIMLVSGKSIPDAVSHFLEITGKPPVPPRWSFKPWFWLMSDPDQPKASIETLKGDHLVEMAQRLKKMNIPVGVTWFEPPWQTARTSFIPNPEFDSNIKGTIKKLSDLGVNTLAWTVPYTAPTSPNFSEAVENGYLAIKKGRDVDYSDVKISKSGEVEGKYYNYIDFFNPEAFDWWKGEINKAIDLGFKGFKPDAGQTLQEDAVLFNGRLGKDVHNSYAREYNRVFFEALSERYGNDFLMVPRAAWVGSSSFSNFKWPGDLRGQFSDNGLPSTVYSSLSLAFCGIPFVSTDIGGFQDRPAPEQVWIRWAQFGAMLPGMQTLHMPWWYSGEAAGHFRFLAWFHTELTPLWTTLANEAHQTGTPVCRPLVWDYQNDIDCWRIEDEFMVGNQLLVAPIINPENNRKVYLPEGRWIDFWKNENVYEGKQTIMWEPAGESGIFSFPLFIKEGAIIPLEVESDITGFGWEKSKSFLTVAVWPEADGEKSFTLKDNGKNISIQYKADKNKLRINWDKSSDFIFRIHPSNDGIPVSILVGEKILQHFSQRNKFNEYDSLSRKIWIKKFDKKDKGEIAVNWSK